MSVSSLNGNSAAALLTLITQTAEQVRSAATPPAGSPSPTPSTGQSNPLESLFKDGFSNGPAQGSGNPQMDLLQSVTGLMDTLQQLQDLIAPELGDDSSQTPPGGQQAGPTPGGQQAGPTPGGQQAGPTPGGTGGAGKSGGAGKTEGAEGSKLGAGMPPQLEQYRGAIENAAEKMGVPANMLAGQIWQESRGNLGATSTNGGNGLTDTGLMQVNPNTFGELKAKHPELNGMDLNSPEGNIMAGAAYMKDMKDQFGDWKTALRAYNSGPNGVDKNNLNALPAGTGDATYVDKVSQFWDTIQSGNGSLPA